MGNFFHGSSCMKVDTVSNNRIDTTSIGNNSKTSKLYFEVTKTNSGNEAENSENPEIPSLKIQTKGELSYGDKSHVVNEPNAEMNENTFVITPRNIEVKGFENSDSQQKNNSHSNETKNERLHVAVKDSQVTNTDLNPLHGNVKRQHIGTYDDQNSQITSVGTADNILQNVQHITQYINVEIHNPSAKALVIGNDNTLNLPKEGHNTQPLHDHALRQTMNTEYVRKNTDEVCSMNQQNEGKKDAFKAEGDEKILDTGSEKLRRSKSALPFRQQKSFQRITKQRSSTVDPRIMLQNFQWNQYEMIQESLLRTVSCEIKKCESEETLVKTIEEIKAKLQGIVEQSNDHLRKSVMKTGHANERIMSGLNEKSKIVLRDANDKLLELERSRIVDLDNLQLSTTHENELDSDRDKMVNYAEEFIFQISKKAIWYISSLLPLKIQHFIIVRTFECQKSFVLKQIMIDCVSSDVNSFMNYILNPNDYAKNWLIDFTDQIIFQKKSQNKPHVYSKMAKQEVGNIVDDLKSAITSTSTKHRKGEIVNLSHWTKRFLQNIKLLPLSSNDIGLVQVQGKVNVKDFIEICCSNLDSMKNEINDYFKNTTINDVQWTDNPYNKIIECLWGCTECCPFCREPCQYSDIEHVTQGNKHTCIQHRPLVVCGSLNDDSKTIMLESCNSLIRSPDRYFKLINEDNPHICSNNDQPFINWEILPVVAADECKYWKWLMCNRKDELRQFFRTTANIISEEWNSITEEEAISSLDEFYICS